MADSAGNMVSFINSNYEEFGVRHRGARHRLRRCRTAGAGFTMEPGLPNTVGPNKRPFHTLIPAFVTRPGANGSEEPWLAFGVMGGAIQPQGHVQVLLNLLEFGMDLQEAIDAARFRHFDGLGWHWKAAIGRIRCGRARKWRHRVVMLDPGQRRWRPGGDAADQGVGGGERSPEGRDGGGMVER